MMNREDPKILAREQRWEDEVTTRLPELLTELLESRIFGLPPRESPPRAYGVYLFSEGSRPRYVGRVGLTERSRRAGKRFSNFRTRLQGHTRPRHNEGTYAYARACESFRRQDLPLANTRAENCANSAFMDEFRRQCQRVRRMGFQVVEIDDNRLASVFEIYAAAALGLRQSFAVS
jgi:hypothetical protein